MLNSTSTAIIDPAKYIWNDHAKMNRLYSGVRPKTLIRIPLIETKNTNP